MSFSQVNIPPEDGIVRMPENSTADPLRHKKVLFAGDSITEALKDNPSRKGWAGRIGEAHEMKWKNAGVSGTSFSTVRPGRIISQLDDDDYDFVILEGGMNDALSMAEPGIPVEPGQSHGDISTMSGALEELLMTARRKYPRAVIGFIIAYDTPNSTWGGRTADTRAYFETAARVCRKQKVPFLDLYAGSVEEGGKRMFYSKDILQTDTPVSLYDRDPGEIHIGKEGYERITPYIEKWMLSIAS